MYRNTDSYQYKIEQSSTQITFAILELQPNVLQVPQKNKRK